MRKRNILRGTSGDALLLMIVKLMTIALSFVVTRLLSQNLSLHDYGTYSQIMLVVSTVMALTALGMIDGVNFYYCSEQDPEKRESYIATLFAMQCIVSAVAGVAVMLLAGVLSGGFDNPDVYKLIFFAAALPLLYNLMDMLQVLLVSIGKAKVLAVRNLLVSVLRLAVVLIMVLFIKNVAVILTATLVMNILQVWVFGVILRKNSCIIRLRSVNLRLIGQILQYCIPMAMFIMMRSINRDMDKYMVGLWTDTETLAVYTNASKPLPFDVILHSFVTVLSPQITRFVATNRQDRAMTLYRVMMELGCLATGVLCLAAMAAAPQLMQLLYSEKYMSGLPVFCLYILVDFFQFTNLTVVLCAAGKTGNLMMVGFGTLGLNALLNLVLYHHMGIVGPALATLIVTLITGLLIMGLSAKALGAKLRQLFDRKFLCLFAVENAVALFLMHKVRILLQGQGWHYFAVLVLVAGLYVGIFLLLQGKRLKCDIHELNHIEK